MSQIPSSLYEKLLADARARGDGPAPRISASVIPWRRGTHGGLEVYWVRRSTSMRFMGGWHAFPGGGLARSDAGVPVTGQPRALAEDGLTEPLPGLDEEARRGLAPDVVPGLAVCVLRELFEETGLLLADGAEDTDEAELLRARKDLLEKKADFAEVVTRQGWRLSAEPLVFAGRWLTPPLAPVRFDNRFFLLEWPASRKLQPVLMGGEHDIGEWIAPAQGLERWRTGEVIASPPILHALKVLAEDGPEKGLTRLHDPSEVDLGPMRRIEFRPGVVLLPLETPTLPPATRTNAFLLGREEVVLVDPATPFPDEIERLKQAVAAAVDQGCRLRAIWLTHHHPDHVGAVNAMREAFGVPVLAHPATAERLKPRGIAVDGELVDGDRVELAGSPPYPVRVYHTPGHAPGHLCFYDETYGSLLIGDLIAGLGTIVIDPPDGDMDAYLDSLERMADLAPKTVFPAHGPVVLEAVKKLREYRDHRLWREEKIVEAWKAGATSARAMVGQVYPDVPAEVHPVAERQIEAHLVRLRRLGKIHPTDPLALFRSWYEDATNDERIRYAHAMCLATVDPGGLPEARTVLLKHLDDGFVFFTDSESPKARSIAGLPEAALVFHWEPLERQVRVRGSVEAASDEVSDECFSRRPRVSQVTAWASLQSRTLASPEELVERVAEIEKRFEGEETLPRPPRWRAYRVRPRSVEFWQAKAGRRHDRLLFVRSEDGGWTTNWLFP